MLIDDEEHIIEYVTELIESFGFRVIGFANGAREALEKLERLDPDIILLDVTMPGLPGSELVAEIKKRKQYVKVIMLTSRNTVHIVKTCIKNGAEGYILKNQGDDYIRQKLFDICGIDQNSESCCVL